MLSFGGRLPLSASVAGALRYHDNIFLTSNKEGDTLVSVTPEIRYVQEGAQVRINASAAEQFLRYASNSSLNRNLPDLAGDVNYEGGRAQLGFTASFAERDQSNTAVRSFDQALRQTETAASLTGDWSATAKTRLSLGSSFNRTNYSDATTVDQDSWTVPLNGYYELTSKVDLSVGYQYRRTRQALARSNSSDHFLNVGASGDFTAKLKGDVRVGVTRRRLDDRGSEEDLGLGASLSYAYSEKTTVNLNLSRDFRTSAFGESQRVSSVQVNSQFLISEVWQANLGFSWERTNGVRNADRNDTFTTLETGVTYVVSRTISASFAYYFKNSSSRVDFYDFNSNIFSVSGMIRF